MGISSHRQSRTLPLLAYDPLRSSSLIDDGLGFRVDRLQAIWSAFGGYWALTFSLRDRQSKIEDWIDGGLGRHIELYNPALCMIWEGYVSEISANIGGLSLHRGPLLDTVANKVKCAYSTVDYSIVPPAVGVRDGTAWAEDTDSQEKYGIIEYTKSVGGATPITAEQIRDVTLEEMRDPKPRETDNLTSSSISSVTVTCLGYVHWLKAYHYKATIAGEVDADAKLQSVLGADPNSLFSTDYASIASNTTQVGSWENKDRTAWNIVQGITALGDAAENRWTFGLYADRKAHYAAMPTAIEYQRRLSDPEQRLERYGTGGRVAPWDALPARWALYSDLLIGKTQPSDIRKDPRYLFIEQATYDAPWGLTLEGSPTGRMDQMLARLGLGGTSA